MTEFALRYLTIHIPQTCSAMIMIDY